MQVCQGTRVRCLDTAALAAWGAAFREVVVGVGTGDGRFVRHSAVEHPGVAFEGVDLCAANLRKTARGVPANALSVVADALALPAAMHGCADRVTLDFPWSSLLRGLLVGDVGLFDGIASIVRRNRTIDLDIRLNAGALAEAGWAFETGCERVTTVPENHSAIMDLPGFLDPAEVRRWPSTWAKRLAFGRGPRPVYIRSRLNSEASACSWTSIPGQPHILIASGEFGQAENDQEAAFEISRPRGERRRWRAG